MTIELRDYFAGKALQGLLANAHLQKEFLKDLDKIEKSMEIKFSDGKRAEYMQHQHASISYAFADAMLKERTTTNKNYSNRPNLIKKILAAFNVKGLKRN